MIKWFNKIIGVMLLSFGIITIVHPEIFTILYDIELNSSDAVAAIRSIIGGSEVAVGMIFLIGPRIGFDDNSLSKLGAAIFSALVLARLYHCISAEEISYRFMREMIVEAIIASLFIFFSTVYRKRI